MFQIVGSFLSFIFHKVALQCLWRVVGCLMTLSLYVYCWVWRWKDFENLSTFGKVMGKNQVSCLYVALYFAPPCITTCRQRSHGYQQPRLRGQSNGISEHEHLSLSKVAEKVPPYLNHWSHDIECCLFLITGIYCKAFGHKYTRKWFKMQSIAIKNNPKTDTNQTVKIPMMRYLCCSSLSEYSCTQHMITAIWTQSRVTNYINQIYLLKMPKLNSQVRNRPDTHIHTHTW